MTHRWHNRVLTVVLLCLILAPFSVSLPQASAFSHVGSAQSISNAVVCCGYQRRSFYAVGLNWQWWYDGANVNFATSADGSSWSSSTSVFATVGGDIWSLTFDGTHVHLALEHTGRGELYYRMGTPNSNGTITWASAEQDTGVMGTTASIAVDSNSHPWIGYRETSGGYPTVIKDNNADGTWSTAPGFPHIVSTTYTTATAVVLALTSGKMYVLYQSRTPGLVTRGTPYNGTSWGSEEIADTQPALGNDWQTQTVIGDTVYHVFVKYIPYELVALSRSSAGVWSHEIYATTLGTPEMPVISHDSAGYLYLFYLNVPFSNDVFYKKSTYPNSIASWSAAVDWISDPTSMPFVYNINAFDHSGANSIGVAFVDGINSPYSIEFQTLPDSPNASTLPLMPAVVITAIGALAGITVHVLRRKPVPHTRTNPQLS